MELMIGEVMSLFHKCDANNDNIMNMDEFFAFGQHMYEAFAFFLRATRDHLDANGDPDDTGFDIIMQKEWDCVQNEAGDGLEYPNCISNKADGQVLVRKSTCLFQQGLWITVNENIFCFDSIQIEDMAGNNGDNQLILWEYL